MLLQDPDCLPEAEVEHRRRVVEAVRGEVVVAVLVVTKVHASPRDVTGREHVNAVTIDASGDLLPCHIIPTKFSPPVLVCNLKNNKNKLIKRFEDKFLSPAVDITF